MGETSTSGPAMLTTATTMGATSRTDHLLIAIVNGAARSHLTLLGRTVLGANTPSEAPAPRASLPSANARPAALVSPNRCLI